MSSGARGIPAWFRACWAIAVLSFGVAWGAAPEDPQKSAEEITKSLGLQRNLPTNTHKSDPDRVRDSGSSGWFGDADASSLAPTAAVFWGFMQWILIAVGAIVLLAFLGDWVMQEWLALRLRGSPQNSQPGVAITDARSLERILADAEKQAAAGQYREALHYVLSAALTLLRSGISEARDSLTSREMIAAAKLEPTARGALRRLLFQVESVWFGQKPVSAGDYSAALTNFRAFREAQWPAR